MLQQGADAMLVTDNVNLYYVSGRVFSGYCYLPADREPLFFVRRPVGLDGDNIVYIRKPEEIGDYLREQGDFLHAVLGPGGDVRFGPRLRDSVCTNLVQSILHERYRNDPSPFVGYYVAFFASAYLGVIERWIETGMQESSEEMALIAMRLFFIKPGESIKL